MHSSDTKDYARNAGPSVPVSTLIGISISAELYVRASAICEMRNRKLDAVIEELIQKFLPRPTMEEPPDEQVLKKPMPEPVKRLSMMSWRRRASSRSSKAGL